METVSCACYFCEGDAVWQIWLAGEDEMPEEAYACEHHARGHLRRAIILPEFSVERGAVEGASAPPH